MRGSVANEGWRSAGAVGEASVTLVRVTSRSGSVRLPGALLVVGGLRPLALDPLIGFVRRFWLIEVRRELPGALLQVLCRGAFPLCPGSPLFRLALCSQSFLLGLGALAPCSGSLLVSRSELALCSSRANARFSAVLNSLGPGFFGSLPVLFRLFSRARVAANARTAKTTIATTTSAMICSVLIDAPP